MTYIIREDDLDVLSLSVRTSNLLKRSQIHTVGALLDYPLEDLKNLPHMGKRTMDEILAMLRSLAAGTGSVRLSDAWEPEAALLSAPEIREEPEARAEPEAQEEPEAPTVVFVEEIPLSELSLSIRAGNALAKAGITTAAQLVALTREDLMKIRNLGAKTTAELLEKIEYLKQNHVVHSSSASDAELSPTEEAIAAEMAAAYAQPVTVWRREMLTIRQQYPEAQGETLLYRLYEMDYVRRVARNTILKWVEDSGDELSATALTEKLPRHLDNTTIGQELLLELEEAGQLTVGEVMVHRKHLSIVQWAAQLTDDREREVLQCRLDGQTLQEIADRLSLTRERVRQLETKAMRGRPYLHEDKYTYIYQAYEISPSDFQLAFDEPRAAYHYLETQCKPGKRAHLPLEDLLTDSNVPARLRKKAERAIYRRFVNWDGVRVRKSRSELVKHAVKVFCRDLTRYDDLLGLYQSQLEELGLGEDPSLALDGRSYENILNKCDYALWNQGRSLRYYNIPEYDFEDLLSTLDLAQYENIEFSALKLFRDYPELMDRYDIRDEYELHNLLKKILPEENAPVRFGRMPTIEAGNGDPQGQLLSLLLQYAPVSAVDLAQKYEQMYGARAATVLGSLFRCIDTYYYNGVYTITSSDLPQQQFARMQAVLTKPLYAIADVKRIYLREFPEGNAADINPYTLKTLGFKVYSDYVVSGRYSSASDYFNEILTTDDIVDTGTFGRTVLNIVAYHSELYRLRGLSEIIEFTPMQYINIRRLNAAGITVEDLDDYRRAVAARFDKGEYFTLHSLREDGFTHPLDDLGFDEWFYSSVLAEDRVHFTYQRLGKNRIFRRGTRKTTAGDVLVWILERCERLDLYDLLELLHNRYDVAVPREKLLEIIAGTDLYYDSIMEAVYIDYDTYFEEI